MVDWTRHYDTIYRRLGVAAVLTTSGTDGDDYDVTVIDKTAGIAVGDGNEVVTIRPACDVRAVEFFAYGLGRDDLKGAAIAFNGKTWDLTHHELRPSPAGERAGELRLFLSEAQA